MNPYQRFVGAAFQMLVTILLGVYAGIYLDAYFHTNKPWFTLGLSLFAIIISLISLIRSLPK